MTIEIVNVDFQKAKSACEKWHYSGTISNAYIKNYGVYEDGAFIGVVCFGYGANNNIGKPYGLTQHEICELTRVSLREHKEFVSSIMMKAIKKLRRDRPKIQLMVSYSDEKQGHLGKIYQATNWIYVGTAKEHSVMIINGKEYHKKSVYEKYGVNGVEKLRNMGVDAILVKSPTKHKYLLPFTKKMRKMAMKVSQPYPKDLLTSGVEVNSNGERTKKLKEQKSFAEGLFE